MFSQASARLFLIWKFLSSRITHDRTVWSEVERVIVLFNCRSFLLIQQMLLGLFPAENVQSGVCRIYIWYKSFSPAQQHMTDLFPPRWDVCMCCLIHDRFRLFSICCWCCFQQKMSSQASAEFIFDIKVLVQHNNTWQNRLLWCGTCDCSVQLPIIFAQLTHLDDAFTGQECLVKRPHDFFWYESFCPAE